MFLKKQTFPVLAVFLLALMVFSPVVSFAEEQKKEAGLVSPERFLSSQTFADLYEKSVPHTVFVVVPNPGFGSGIIWSEDGYILTNNHVVEGKDKVKVFVSGNKFYWARVVGTEPREDVALLKIDETVKLSPAPMGDSNLLRPGEYAYAIGNPFGHRDSITVGVISGLNRLIEDSIQEVIQTDVAINPGNSGGALFNAMGQVIGMNVAVYRGANTIGYTLPINDVLWVAEKLKAEGKVRYARLGAYLADLSNIFDEKTARAYDLPWPLPQEQGIIIARVEPGSPAEKAGLKAGDTVVSFNGVLIERTSQFSRLVARSSFGTQYPVVVLRSGVETKIQVELKEHSSTPEDKVLGELRENTYPNFGEALNPLPKPVQKAIKQYSGILAEVSTGINGRRQVRVTNAFVIDRRLVIAPSSFLNPNMEYAMKGSYIFNRIPAELVFFNGSMGLAMFRLEKPYENFKNSQQPQFKVVVGEEYYAFVLKDMAGGDAKRYLLPLNNKLELRELSFLAIISRSGLGAPVFNQEGEVVGMLHHMDEDSQDPGKTDEVHALSSFVIKRFIEEAYRSGELGDSGNDKEKNDKENKK